MMAVCVVILKAPMRCGPATISGRIGRYGNTYILTRILVPEGSRS